MSRILVVEDEEKMRYLLGIMLERKGHKVLKAGDGMEALEILHEESCDMVISDIKMPRMDGHELLSRLKAENMPCPVVFITAFATVESAVEAMRQGAADYITKPFEEDRILLTVERTLRLSKILTENIELKYRLQSVEDNDEIIYVSQSMAEVIDLAGKVAQSDSAVLITGDSGTGKELIARYIHKKSCRTNRRFVPVNCAAISANIVESELFGHEKGAFTGAEKRTMGKFEYTSGGTLFLDEIGDLPLEAQAKLLRALQEKKINRVGGNEELPVDVRVLCATNQKLPKCVERGDFRQDLYYRINVFPIYVPPLRERMEDVLPIAKYFLKKFCDNRVQLNESANKALMAYSWPGNVRELANAIERGLILSGSSGVITNETLDFLDSSRECVCPSPENNKDEFRLTSKGILLEELEDDLVRQALQLTANNQTSSAKLLGISRAKFRVLLKQMRNNEN